MEAIWSLLRRLRRRLARKNFRPVNWRDHTPRVFCVSMQRTGTTSVGKFFRDFGFVWAGWPHPDWSRLWYQGDFEAIFSSPEFLRSNAYEDDPWWLPGFYKVLFHRFPNAKFVLFTRNPDSWYQSMLWLGKGSVIGRTKIHCKIYRRELEYFDLLRAGLLDAQQEHPEIIEKTMKMAATLAEHYKNIYILHNLEVQEFFQRHAPKALFVADLEDPDKWMKLGHFLGVKVPPTYDSRENVSKKEVAEETVL
jgi:hypothetical protein